MKPVLVTALVAGALLYEADTYATSIEYSDNNLMALKLGSGYDSAKNELLSEHCIENPKVVTPSESDAQYAALTIKELSSLQELSETLDADASLSARFGIGNRISGSARYASSKKFTTNNYYLLVNVEVRNLTQSLEKPRLTKAAYSLLKQDSRRFAEICGNEFVRTIVTGGQFSAVLQFSTSSTEDKKDLEVKLRGIFQYGTGKVEVATDAASRLASITEKNSMTAEILRKGDKDALVDPRDPKAIIAYALSFPTKVKQNPYPLRVSTSPYSAAMDPDDLAINTPDYSIYEEYLRSLLQQYEHAISSRNDLIYADSHRDEFGKVDWEQLGKTQVALEEYIAELSRTVAGCMRSAARNKTRELPAKQCPRFDKRLPDISILQLDRPACRDFSGRWAGTGTNVYKSDYLIELMQRADCSLTGRMLQGNWDHNPVTFALNAKRGTAIGTTTITEATSKDVLKTGLVLERDGTVTLDWTCCTLNQIRIPSGWTDSIVFTRRP